MKSIRYTGLVMAAAAVIGLASCKSGPPQEVNESAEEVQQDHTRDEQIKQELAADRADFNAAVNARIEENKREIAELRERMKEEKKEARERYEASINDLEKRNDEMKARLDNNKEESKEKWNSFKAEFNHDMDELGHSIKDLFKDNVK